ncbi:hypothetical protein Tco_0998285 [Tanacetum coccineum]
MIPIVEKILNEEVYDDTGGETNISRITPTHRPKLYKRVEALRDKLKAAQLDVSLLPHDAEKKKLAALTLDEYQEAMDDEEKLLFQCAKVDWLNEGDRTTAYFHKVVKEEFVKHFDNFLGQSTHVDLLDTLGDIFTTTLTNNEAISMVKEVTDQEKKIDMFGIGDCKAPGPDGYTACCKKLKLTHHCFADDLLVMCYGNIGSVKIIKESIDAFSRVSGLEPNLNKSTIFFGNVSIGDQRSILSIVLFKVGAFLVKYLGVPLITKRLNKDECIFKLITSVLGSMQIYWASIFLLPKSIVKDIEKVLKGFLCCQGDLDRGKAKIAWKTLCKPKAQGRLGFKDLGKWNESEWSSSFLELMNILVPILSNDKDKAVWRCKNRSLKGFSIKQT